MAWLITDAAHKTLPLLKPIKTNRFKDRTLSQLCAKSKEAWGAWCGEGRPYSPVVPCMMLSVLCGEKSVIE